MRVLLTGSGGQLGRALQASLPPGIELQAPTRDQLDITDPVQLERWLAKQSPDWVINCAAYTRVDQAESEPEAAEAVNHFAVKRIADLIAGTRTRVLHVSTDYVFDGAANQPYSTDALCAPRGVYGASKYQGEQAMLEAAPDQATVVRTSWLYAEQGQNFLMTMLRLMATRPSISVVVDQVGTPTSCRGLAQFLWWATAQRKLPPLLHWADTGVASWYDFAVAIMEEACLLGLLPGPIEVLPIASRDYPQAAPRPAYSVLDAAQSYQLSGFEPVHWREGLRRTLRQLVNQRVSA